MVKKSTIDLTCRLDRKMKTRTGIGVAQTTTQVDNIPMIFYDDDDDNDDDDDDDDDEMVVVVVTVMTMVS